jgi:ubiquinone/menaquinone biosynthesis C-methylase UbiE
MQWRIGMVLPIITGKLLDIGCGTNELVRQYRGDGLGVDVYQWGDVDLVVGDSAKLPFQNKAFDTITIVAALNHIPNRRAVLKEAHRVISDEGKIIITMIPPFVSRIWHFLRKPWDADQSERGMKMGEVYGLNTATVRALLNETGFSVMKEKRFMMGFNCLTIGCKSSFADR